MASPVATEARRVLSRSPDDTNFIHPNLLTQVTKMMQRYPYDNDYLLEVSTGTFGVITCMSCFTDVELEANPLEPDGGKHLGFGSFDAYIRHCGSPEHAATAKSKRLAAQRKASAKAAPPPQPAASRSKPVSRTASAESNGAARPSPSTSAAARQVPSPASMGGGAALRRAAASQPPARNAKLEVLSDDDDVVMTSHKAGAPSSSGSRKRASDALSSDEEITVVSSKPGRKSSATAPKKAKMEEEAPAGLRSPMKTISNNPNEYKPARAGPSNAPQPPAPAPAPAQGQRTFASAYHANLARDQARTQMQQADLMIRQYSGLVRTTRNRQLKRMYQESLATQRGIKQRAQLDYTAASTWRPPVVPPPAPFAQAGAGAMQDVKPDIKPQLPGGMPGMPQDSEDEEMNGGAMNSDDEMAMAVSGISGYRGNSTAELNEFLANACDATQFSGNEDVNAARKNLGIEPGAPDRIDGLSDEIVLMPHQLLGVSWMFNQEKKKAKGGILADQMGLGKTVQSIACMLQNRPDEEEDGPKTTLILAPLALLEQWAQEIEDKTEAETFSVLIYHGQNKPKKAKEIMRYDVVLTTLQTMSMEWAPNDDIARKAAKRKDKKKGIEWGSDEESTWMPAKKDGPLVGIKYHRIIIDEAHNIRNKNTRVSRAVTRLKATYRWCLSGTPIVNSTADLYGFLRFLRMRPWFDWSEFNNQVVIHEKKNPNLAVRRAQGILLVCMFRRKKDSKLDGKLLVELPNKSLETQSLNLSIEERQIYESVQSNAQVKFSRFLKAGTVMKNYAHVLVLLLRLRQICDHPALITEDPHDAAVAKLEDEKEARKQEVQRARDLLGDEKVDKILKRMFDQAVEQIQKEKDSVDAEIEDGQCPMCFDVLDGENGRITGCGHVGCEKCMQDILDRDLPPAGEGDEEENVDAKRPCPTCRTAFSAEELFRLEAFRPDDEDLEEIKGDAAEEEEERREQMERKKDAAFLDDSDTDMEDDLPDVRSKRKSTKKKSKVADSDDGSSPVKPGKRMTRMKKKAAKRVLDSDDSDDMRDFIASDDDAETHKIKEVNTDDEDGSEAEEDSEDETQPRKKLRGMAKDLLKDGSRQKIVQVKKLSKFIVSTKMKKMYEILEETKERSDNKDKTIIFSQWTSCLDLLDHFLREKGYCFVRYQGDMSRKERDLAVKSFMNNKKVKVMLMSLKCGGVGLNLTRANNVISLDLAWSPATEAQAFDRVHRLGQTKDVFVNRLVIENSVEDRLLTLQATKGNLAAGSLDGEILGGKPKKLTVRE